jgi:hypothetical protein
MDYEDLKIIVSSVPGLWQSRGKPGGQAEKNSIVEAWKKHSFWKFLGGNP